MKIYVAHSSSFDFEGQLYKPLRSSSLNADHEFVFPHEGMEQYTKDVLKTCDLVIAEVSLPSTGEGIELGWADLLGVPVVAIHKEGSEVSSSIKLVAKELLPYTDFEDMLAQIATLIQKHA